MKRKTAIKKLMTVVDRNTANIILDTYHGFSGFTNALIVMFFTHYRPDI